ncbi:hypothetical protein BDV93DRAFT_559276 [Ceratobasidium sp. AG-I]|nr:hypothetical protein BDV93DRAFT_559276 [Ceratobasidium sp. AG-I]
MMGEPQKEHTDQANSAAFSADGTRIVSGSGDEAIRIRDTDTGKMVGEPPEVYVDGVRLVAATRADPLTHSRSTLETRLNSLTAYFSSNAHIVSGSSDDAIRMANFGHMPNDPHRGWVIDEDGFMLSCDSQIVM